MLFSVVFVLFCFLFVWLVVVFVVCLFVSCFLGGTERNSLPVNPAVHCASL